jgi:hypothetical protein
VSVRASSRADRRAASHGFETRYEVDGFLKARGIPVQEGLEEIQRDSELVLNLGRP